MTLKQKKCVVLAILLPFCTTVVTAAFLLAFMKTMFGGQWLRHHLYLV